MRSPRTATTGALLALVALMASPITAASAAEPPPVRGIERPVTPAGDEPSRMVDVEPGDFAAEGAALPADLRQALARDVGLSGAEWLAQSEAGNAAADVVADLTKVIDVVDARLEGYDLVVTVENAADARLAQSVGARVELGSAAAVRGTEVIEGLEPAADLRGGLPYIFNNAARCSVGFAGINTTTDQLQMLSAGHCEDAEGDERSVAAINRPTVSGGSLSSPLTTLGNGGLHVTDEYPNPGFTEETFYDLGLTPVSGSGWVGKPEVVTWGNSTSGSPLASSPLVVRDAGPAVVGSTVCKSGASTGWTCGPITDVDSVAYVGTGAPTCPATVAGDYCVAGIEANICVRRGDSGGPALVGSRAVGISSAATNAAVDTTCNVAGNIGIFATLYSADPALEQVTKVYPDWEPLIGFASTSRNATSPVRLSPSATPNVLGRVTGGSSRHSVEVSLNGGAPVGAAVSSNGNWSAPLDGLRGTIEWSATASWGSQTQTSPTTGRFFVADAVRLSGANRYDTANAIAANAFPGSPNVPVVYIANGGNFPDALSAGPAAAAEGGPLLLTERNSLPSSVRSQLNRLNPDTIVIVGGTGVVSGSVASALRSYADSVVRIGGANRYETSRLITQRGLSRGFFTTGQQVWVATGANYADALSAGAAAASAGVPILLVDGTASGIDSATRTFLSSKLKPTVARIAGGTAVVSNGVKNAIDAVSGVSTARYGGVNRFATSLVINKFAHPNAAPKAFLTYGLNFPDALAGGVLAGLEGGPMYITEKSCVERGVVDHILDLGPGTITVFGGTAVVSNSVRDLRRC
ncbi:MAG: cell wall-binding repeat-containing protein [Actinobacteria bacterium]|nr:cell wall-binding repeat-containing protein [Actinomycetota bacterium]MBU1609371.1 cell wall-binding repeat-containing protein [Actinomycetota bacterium]MBU2315003.1 cell wall-binding repeat-containing protein [Actinomycetota bacterium]MBU2385031.1 cell wall-binding repeat-containing protein [Actinomycetota bacterium]